MSLKVLLKKSSVLGKIPQPTDLVYGEIALNYADGKLYFKDSNNLVKSFSSSLSINDLTDVDTTSTSPNVGDVLKWDGSKWAPGADATVGGTGTDADTLDGFDSSYFLNYNNLSNKPTIPSLTGYATETYVSTYVNTEISNLVASAPTTLNTLNELALALGNDANFATTVSTQIGLKANSADLATVATSGSYTDLSNKPTLFSGSYNDLTNKPTLFSGSYTDLTNKPTLFSGSYDDLTNKPTIPSLTGYATETYVSTQINNLINAAPGTLDTLGEIAAALQSEQSALGALTTVVNSKIGLTSLSVTTNPASGSGSLSYNNTNGTFTFTPPVLFSGSYTDLTNKPTLFSGSYTDLTNKPTLFSGSYNDLSNKPTIPTVPTLVSAFTNDANYVNATQLATKQDTLVSGTSIKTINGQSLLGSGNITITGGTGGGATVLDDLTDVDTTTNAPANGQALVYNSSSAKWIPQTISGGSGSLQEYSTQAAAGTTTIDSIPLADFTVARYNIGMVNDMGNYETTEFVVIQNGNLISYQQYNQFVLNASTGSLTAVINGTNADIQFNANSFTTNIKFTKSIISKIALPAVPLPTDLETQTYPEVDLQTQTYPAKDLN